MEGLAGRVALVTGAGRGIGRGIARRLAAEGCPVVLNDLEADVAGAAAEEIHASGGSSVPAAGNVADSADTDAMVAAAEEEFGGLDIVVNNAGLTADDWLHRMADETWDLVTDVCLRGTFNVCRSASRLLRRGKDDPTDYHRKVVNIASINGIYGSVANANYSAAKAGVIGLSKALAREWAGQKINVNVIAPGYIEGTRLTAVREEGDRFGIPADVKPGIVEQIPIGRPGTPADVAALTAFLASSESDYLTGQVIELHGGLEIIRVVG